jgi:hypothetical protein
VPASKHRKKNGRKPSISHSLIKVCGHPVEHQANLVCLLPPNHHNPNNEHGLPATHVSLGINRDGEIVFVYRIGNGEPVWLGVEAQEAVEGVG